jgi:hypothetical protein
MAFIIYLAIIGFIVVIFGSVIAYRNRDILFPKRNQRPQA